MIRFEYGRLSGRFIQSYSARAIAFPGGILRIECRLTASRTMLRLGVTCIRVQDAHGADFETVWNTDVLRGGMTGYGSDRHSLTEEVAVPPGTYTALVTFYARNGLGSDTVTCRTDPVTVE